MLLKSGLVKVLAVVVVGVVVCLSLVFVGFFLNRELDDGLVVSNEVFSEADFPLEVDLPKTVFRAGEKISGTASIVNKSGKDIEIASNGQVPCIYLHNSSVTNRHGDISISVTQTLKAGDKLSKDFSYETKESGTYILYVHYVIYAAGSELWDEKELIIEVK